MKEIQQKMLKMKNEPNEQYEKHLYDAKHGN